MAAKLEIVKAKHSHIWHIAKNLRQSDQDELRATNDDDFVRVITRAIKESTLCWTALVDGKPSVIFGVANASILGQMGVPWLLATDDARKIRRSFLIESKPYIERMLEQFPYLRNYVDVRNEPSIRWLKWLGFEIMDPIEFGVNKELFHPFEMRAG